MSPAIRTRSRAVVALLALGGAAFAVSAPVWLRTTVSTALEPQVAIEVAGTTAAPAVSAAAFVTLACALATTLAGAVARRVALAVALLGGLAVGGGAAAVLLDPEGPAVAAAADAAGVTTLTSSVTVTAWPWFTLVVGLAIVLVAVASFLGASSWQASGGRHERAGAAPGPVVADEPDAQSDWDALSGGTDPSADR
ncbi:tryptophan-associated transmembrane protein [Isoptericola jiangsuensis]|uniref:Tryptophan-associated transmembrane protein n=1 Tax=Isoptericola jiangsuensis TaxID=548579 RepID=A0A2A9EX48_9MICO|nr:Trp biosynthesis-associated membrane protein [Isoptericola jiangsuensis]PFG43091.1 tryptophan-associated transmembrane protein [Isoptericola jiangsuensis]